MQRILGTIFLYLIIAILTLLFFIGGPGYRSARSFQAFWNLGHIVYYAVLPMAIFTFTRQKPRAIGLKIAIVLIVALVLGIIVELVQAGFDRSPDTGDLFRNMIGAILGIAFILPGRKMLPKVLLRALQIIAIVLVVLQVYPVAIAVIDEYLARSEFPILADFEDPHELQRWTGSAARALDNGIKLTGKHAMRVSLDTILYSGVSLTYFPGDWTGYSQFQFSICNPISEPLSITCRIHDMFHTQGVQRYKDRYNRSFTINEGWHTININLEDVKTAPDNRTMDMRHIQGVGIFATRLPRPRVMYVDHVRLIR